MKDETFAKGMRLLTAVFRGLTMPPVEILEIWKSLLNDIPDERFIYAVKKVCNNVRDIYPGTNIVALIREQLIPKVIKP